VIVVDTSALVAMILGEEQANAIDGLFTSDKELVISAVTLGEALIVSGARGFGSEMARLIERLHFEVIPVLADDARLAADAYSMWGKGYHPAKLNFADSFAYALAKSRGCPLLFVGDDFTRTDIVSAL